MPTKATNRLKVHRRRLSPETLIAYQLPWEWDEYDSNYIIIKRWIPEQFMEELFEHTRRLERLERLQRRQRLERLEEKLTGSAYGLARCEKTFKPLSFDVKLRTRGREDDWDDRSQGGGFWSRGKRKSSEKNVYCERASFSHSRSFDDTRVALYRLGPPSEGLAPQLTWYHIRRDPKDFEEFLNLATSFPGLDDEDIALIHSLLKKVRHGAKPCFAVEEATKPGKSATFLAFPYFSVKAVREGADASNPSLYPTRSLLELAYSLDSTRQRDMEQAICKTGHCQNGHVLHVPQVWVVIVNSRFILTSCTIDMFGRDIHSLKIMDIPAPPTPLSPSVVRVTDPYQRLFFLPMDGCKTWFALLDNVRQKCLGDYDLQNHDFQLETSDHLVVQADNWDELVRSHTSTFLNLCVRFLEIQWELEKSKVPGYSAKKSHRMPKAATAEASDVDSVHKDEESKEKYRSEGEDSEPGKMNAWVKYDPESLPPNRHPKLPIPPSSGVVVNTPRRKPNKRSDIYFVPKSSKEGNVAVEKQVKRSQQDNSTEAAPLNESKGPDIARPTLPSRSKVQPSVPPVFTWATGGEQRSSVSRRHRQAVGTPAPLRSGARAQASTAIHDSHSEEESLRNVCLHIHTDLLESSWSRDRELYLTMRPSTSHQVASLVGKTHSVSGGNRVILDHVSSADEAKANHSVSQTKMQRIYDHLSSLFAFFIPVAYPSKISDAYWGAHHVILERVSEICDLSKVQSSSLLSAEPTASEYYIVDLSGESGQDLRNPRDLELLTKPFVECNVCQHRTAYRTLSDAQTHLFTDHFELNIEERHVVSSHWIASSIQYPYYIRHTDGHAILDRLQYHLEELERLSGEIRSGVCTGGVFDRESYRIPSALVEAFGRILVMVLHAASVAESVCNSCDKHDQSDMPVSFIDEERFEMVSHLGFQAETAMHEARKQLMLMACTDDVADAVSYEALSPDFVLVLVLDEIHNHVAYRNTTGSVLAVYQDYIAELQRQVNVRPRKRLLRPITYLSEELSIIKSVTAQQQLVLKNFRNILDPTSFHVTTETRHAAFKLEDARISRILADINHDLESIEELIRRAETLSAQTRSAVEARQEDHGKAILVFTIVTVTFLPMSFVTSFFGMNTSDIRDLPDGQWVFWVVALPISAVTIGLSLVIGFHGDRIREAIEKSALGRGSRGLSPPPLDGISDRSSDNMTVLEEEAKASSHGWLPGPNVPRRKGSRRLG